MMMEGVYSDSEEVFNEDLSEALLAVSPEVFLLAFSFSFEVCDKHRALRSSVTAECVRDLTLTHLAQALQRTAFTKVRSLWQNIGLIMVDLWKSPNSKCKHKNPCISNASLL